MDMVLQKYTQKISESKNEKFVFIFWDLLMLNMSVDISEMNRTTFIWEEKASKIMSWICRIAETGKQKRDIIKELKYSNFVFAVWSRFNSK